MGFKFRPNVLHKTGFQLYQIKCIAHFQEPIKRLLRHDFAMRTPTHRLAVGCKPRLGQRSEIIGVHMAQKRPIGRVGRRLLITPQVRANGVQHRCIAVNVTDRFRPIAHQSGGMGQEKADAADHRLYELLHAFSSLRTQCSLDSQTRSDRQSAAVAAAAPLSARVRPAAGQ